MNEYMHDELHNERLRGRVNGACGVAVVKKNLVAEQYAERKTQIVEFGTLVEVWSLHDTVRFSIVHEDVLQVDEKCLTCKAQDIALVDENLWASLFPLSRADRVPLVSDERQAKRLASIVKGTIVQVVGKNDKIIAFASVEYIGHIDDLRLGIYYGLKILNCGENYEELKKIANPTEELPPHCDLIVTINRIRPTTKTKIEIEKFNFLATDVKNDPPLWLPKSMSHHSFRTSTEVATRRQTSRSVDLTTTKLTNHSPLNKTHSSSRSLELPESSNRRCYRSCASLDNDIPHRKNINVNGTEDYDSDLSVGSLVEIPNFDHIQYGVIRRIYKNFDKIMAEVEMEEYDDDFDENGYYPTPLCNKINVPLANCQRDSRFQDKSRRRNTSANTFGVIDCPVVQGIIPPITADLKALCGKDRGIQGHHNSCYLDATLFSMFAFTSVLDSILYRPRTRNDIAEYEEVQRVLRDEIVNPLRKNVYVRADRVMKLRTLLDKLSSVSGLTSEEKDPEEFLNSLLSQILRAEPFLQLSSDQKAFHYQLFVEKDHSLTLPTVQQLFEQSFTASDIKLKQLPSCLIVQMPRFGKAFKMYPRILPSTVLDVTDVIQDSPRECTSCGNLAELECKECYISGMEGSSFCEMCSKRAHSHFNRSNHKMRKLTVPVEYLDLQQHSSVPRLIMNLFAVVCIETSHYVTFLNTSKGWVFFDSMADRKGEQNGYNIPEIVHCPDLPYWLSEEGALALEELQDDRELPELAKRLLCDAYMCMYQSPDVMMYK